MHLHSPGAGWRKSRNSLELFLDKFKGFLHIFLLIHDHIFLNNRIIYQFLILLQFFQANRKDLLL